VKKNVNHLSRYVILAFNNRPFSSYDGPRKKNQPRSALGLAAGFLTCLLIWNIIFCTAFAQEEEEKEGKKGDVETEAVEEEEKFTNYGLISISNKGELSKDRKYVAFNIINNAGRSISNLFGWVYRYGGNTAADEGNTEKKETADEKTIESTEGKEGIKEEGKGYVLANYPHKGGVCITGRFHKPGQKAKWRFMLKRVVPEEIEEVIPKFLLLVNMNSIFFAKVETTEPTPPPEEEEEEEITKEGEVKESEDRLDGKQQTKK
jgi:hypothetical protein